MDRRLGLIHVRIQTWFPMPIQVYVNGHEWLARKLEANDVGYTKRENVFLWIQDIARAQRFEDPVVARKILDSLGLPSRPPPVAPARRNRHPQLTEF